jgi:hypothetical protein
LPLSCLTWLRNLIPFRRFICDWYMRFALKTIEVGLSTVPESMTPNAVSRRALRLLKLTRQQAIMAADVERATELQALSGVFLEADAPARQRRG